MEFLQNILSEIIVGVIGLVIGFTGGCYYCIKIKSNKTNKIGQVSGDDNIIDQSIK